VDLWLSMDDGATWASLASGVPNTGTYQWTVPSPGTNTGVTPVFTARIRVEAEDGGGNPSLDESDAGFSIFDPSTPTIITQLGAFSDDDGLRIQWQVAPNMVFTSLVLERADNTVGPWVAVNAAATQNGAVTVIVDRTVTGGHSYWYRLAGTLPGGAVATFG